MAELANVVNLGKVIEEQLNETGVYSLAEWKIKGSKQAWLDIQKNDESACIHRLQALEGAIRGIRKKELPQAVKDDLKAFYQADKKQVLR